MRIPRPKLNYANLIATIALFVALGGAAVAAGLPKNSVGTKQLKRGAVTAADLRRNAVRPGKIAPRAVVAGKLGANAVLPGNLGNGIITSNKLSDGAVIASKIKNGVVTTNKLDNDAVTTAKLAPGSVTNPILANGSVTPNKLNENFGPIVATLKSGQTLRGTFAIGGGGTKTEVGDEAYGAVTYQFPLANAPQATVLDPGETNSNCSGPGGATPQAAPGHVCIYLNGWANLDTSDPLGIYTLNDSRLGFGLAMKARDAGSPFWATGVWAVTAP